MTKSDLEQHIQKYQNDLSRLCFSLCGDYSDSEDLYQETWIKAIRFYDRYDSSKAFDKWIYSICVNTYKDIYRSRIRRKTIEFKTTEEKDRVINAIVAPKDLDEDYFELISALSHLPYKYKIVISLRYFNNYSETDVAQILSIPIGTVKSRASKAKALLVRRLKV